MSSKQAMPAKTATRVIIPKSELHRELDRTTEIKAEMTELLRELESAAYRTNVKKPGGWRQDPAGWSGRLT